MAYDKEHNDKHPRIKYMSDVAKSISQSTDVHEDVVKRVISALWPEITLRMIQGQTFYIPETLSVYAEERKSFKSKLNFGPLKGQVYEVDAHRKLKMKESLVMTVRLNLKNNYRAKQKRRYLFKLNKPIDKIINSKDNFNNIPCENGDDPIE